VHGNPAELVELKQVVTEGYLPTIRQRTLSAKEIRELSGILDAMTSHYCQAEDKRSARRPLLPETQQALWLCLATGCRIGELLMSRWEDVDLENAKWFVPRQNTKTRVDWLVFLSDFALQHFQKLRSLSGDSEWCFPSRLAHGHVSVKSVTKQVGDRQMRFKCRKPLSRRRNDDSLVLDGGRQGEWTPHDLRRTAATMMQALGVNPDVIDRCQNHVLPGSKIRRHYLLHDYAEEKRRAWQLLGQRLETTLGDGNVLQLVRTA
jgi:integrase